MLNSAEASESSLGKSGLHRLIKKGLLEIISPEWAKRILDMADGKVEIKDSKSGKVYLVNGNIKKSEAMAVQTLFSGTVSTTTSIRL